MLPRPGNSLGSGVTDGVAEIIRVAYDIEAEVAALRAAGHPDSGRLAEMRRRGRFIRPEPTVD